ncbi:hypothetical protein MRX96_028734 [Rhipicephalus microplus]
MLHGIRRSSTVGSRNPFPTKSCSCEWQPTAAASGRTRQHSGSARARSSRYSAAQIPCRPVRASRLDAFYPDASPADAIRTTSLLRLRGLQCIPCLAGSNRPVLLH